MRKLYFLLLSVIAVPTAAQNYTVLGNASIDTGCNCYTLTPNAVDQSGAIFQTNAIDLTNAFDYSFSVFLGCNGATGADGICFVLTTNPNGLGSNGQGLGYGGAGQLLSLAVEFDTWQNNSFPTLDPAYDHIGIESQGLTWHNVSLPVAARTNQSNIDDCAWHTVRITWDPATGLFTVYFDGVQRQQITIANMAGTYFGGNPIVYWGWSGGTGSGTNLQKVCMTSISNWTAGTNYSSCSPTVQFTDVSTSNIGSVQSWHWDFGDGDTSTLQNPTHTYSAAGTYNVTLTITDVSGCTYSYSHPVVVSGIILNPAYVQPLCFGGTGTITVTATGGSGNYTYSWNSGTPGTNNSFTGTAGTHTVSVSDGSSCGTSAQYTLNQPPQLTVTSSHTDVTCGAANDGTITINVAGGTPSYTYRGNTVPAGITTISGLAAGTYNDTVTDANGCFVLVSETVTAPVGGGNQSLTVSSTPNTCNGGAAGTAAAELLNATGTPSYVWSNGGNTDTITGLQGGTYAVTASDQTGCSLTATVTVTDPPPTPMNATPVDAACFGGNGSATANPVGGTAPFRYTWSMGTDTVQTVALPAGTYTVTATDANSCNQTATVTIGQTPDMNIQVAQTNINCFGDNTGDIVLTVTGGTGTNYTYTWLPNVSSNSIASLLTAGTYDVTVTDEANCTKPVSIVLTQPSQAVNLNIQSNNVSCFGLTNGSIKVNVVGGTPGYTYTWNPNVSNNDSATGLTPNNYNITVTDSKNCRVISAVTISQPNQPLTLNPSLTHLKCYQVNDGVAAVNVSGGTFPYTYVWSPNVSNTNTADSLAAGTYNVTVTDNNGCINNTTLTLTQPTQLTTAETHVDVLCYGRNTGSVAINAQGGTPGNGYTYTWNPNVSVTDSANNITAGTYNVLVTDSNNCTATQTAVVTEPPLLTLAAPVTDVVCFGGSTGSIQATANGGTPAYSFSADDGTQILNSANGQFSQLPSGSYSITVTDQHMCTATFTSIVNEPAVFAGVTTVVDATCKNYHDGSVTIAATGGTPMYQFVFSNGQSNTSGAFTNLGAGSYAVTVTDGNGCSFTDTATVTEPDSVLVGVTPTPVEVALGESLQINTVTNQGGVLNYVWTPATGLSCYDCANPVFSGNYSQNYNLLVTNNSGCRGTAALTVTVKPNYDVFFPNAFTPNGDGNNDLWQMFANWKTIKQIDVMVFNRIGEKVFESEEMNFGWDGLFKGKEAPNGVYVYHAKIVWLNNHSDSRYIGSITLIR